MGKHKSKPTKLYRYVVDYDFDDMCRKVTLQTLPIIKHTKFGYWVNHPYTNKPKFVRNDRYGSYAKETKGDAFVSLVLRMQAKKRRIEAELSTVQQNIAIAEKHPMYRTEFEHDN